MIYSLPPFLPPTPSFLEPWHRVILCYPDWPWAPGLKHPSSPSVVSSWDHRCTVLWPQLISSHFSSLSFTHRALHSLTEVALLIDMSVVFLVEKFVILSSLGGNLQARGVTSATWMRALLTLSGHWLYNFFLVCVCVCMCLLKILFLSMCLKAVHLKAGAYRGQSCWVSMEPKLQAVVSCLMWVLGTKFRSSARSVCSMHFLFKDFFIEAV